ncbi:MAG: MFS transporter [bacterium]|nr:MFS transporter [bacterium]MCP5069977.1 MFS transporter [bacterium]
MSIPGQTMGISVFTDHLIEATGLTRLQISNAYLLGTIVSGLLLPMGGNLVDRFGVRRMVVMACTGLAVMLTFLAFADRLAFGLAASVPDIPSAAACFGLLAIGFTGIRFSGQGMLTLVSRTMLARWFERRRGLVSAISGPFVNFAFAGAPLLLALWIGRAGWRGAWLEMAATVGIGMGLIGWLLFRENPEECGLHMDGDAPAPETLAPETHGSHSRDFTRAEALRTGAFWLVTLGIGIQAMVGTGITFHIVDLGAEMGLSAARSVAIFLPIALVTTPVGFLAGTAADRFPIRWLIITMLAGQAVMFAGVANMGDPWMRIVAIAGWGVAGGFYGPLTVAALPKFFGRTHLGSIQGAMMSCLVIASALGPSSLAWLRNRFGSYEPGLYLMIALPVAVVLVAPFIGDPAHRTERH